MTEEQIRSLKLGKIEQLRSMGQNPYPDRFERTHTLEEASQLSEGTPGVRIAGRMVSRREFGKLAFFDLQDLRGRCQASIQAEHVGKEQFKLISMPFPGGCVLSMPSTMVR